LPQSCHSRPRPGLSSSSSSVIPGSDRKSPSLRHSRLRPAISSSFPTRPAISLTQTLGHAKMQCARCVPFPCALRSLRLTLRARKTQIYALYRLFVCLKVWYAMWDFVRNFYRHGRPDRPSPATPSVIPDPIRHPRPHPSFSALTGNLRSRPRHSRPSRNVIPGPTGDLPHTNLRARKNAMCALCGIPVCLKVFTPYP